MAFAELPKEIISEILEASSSYEAECLSSCCKTFRDIHKESKGFDIRRDVSDNYPALLKLCFRLFRNARLDKKPQHFTKLMSRGERRSLKRIPDSEVRDILSSRSSIGCATLGDLLLTTAQSVSIVIEFVEKGYYGPCMCVRLASEGGARCIQATFLRYVVEGTQRKILSKISNIHDPYKCVNMIVAEASIASLNVIESVRVNLTEHPNNAIAFKADSIYKYKRTANAAFASCVASRGPRLKFFAKAKYQDNPGYPWAGGIGVYCAKAENRDLIRISSIEILRVAPAPP